MIEDSACESELTFGEFPLSYRLAQGSMFLAVIAFFIAGKLQVRKLPGAARFAAGCAVLAVVVFGLLISAYVVIRYPFLSLVDSSDADYFKRCFPSSSSKLYRILSGAVLVVLGCTLPLFFINGIPDPAMAIFIAYFVVMFLFMVFMTFVYDPEKYPTIATFIRATFGIGLVLFPIFLPVLIVASFRCRRLLDEFADVMPDQSELY